jgi:hypothetical protein
VKSKLVFIAVMVAVLIANIRVSNTFAGGPRMDWDERFEHIPGAPECWVDGFDDGRDGPFIQSRNDVCTDKGDGQLDV